LVNQESGSNCFDNLYVLFDSKSCCPKGLVYQRVDFPEGWFPRGLISQMVDSPEDWFPRWLVSQRVGSLDGWFPRGLLPEVSSLRDAHQ